MLMSFMVITPLDSLKILTVSFLMQFGDGRIERQELLRLAHWLRIMVGYVSSKFKYSFPTYSDSSSVR